MAEVMAEESGHNSRYEFEFKVPSLLTTQLGACGTRTLRTEMALKSKYSDVYIPDNLSWPHFVFQNFERYGDQTAVNCPISGCHYTFKQLKTLTTNFASALVKRGLKKGDVLGIYLPNIAQYPIVYYGSLFLGITVTTVNPQYGVQELVYQLRDCSAKYLITDRERLANAQRAGLQVGISAIFTMEEVKGFESFQDLVQDDGSKLPRNYASINPKDDVAILLYSSGTTGLPKGCMLTHYNLVALACIFDEFAWPERSVVLTVLPLFHGYSQSIMMGFCLWKGCELVVLQGFEPKTFLQTLENFKVAVLPIVPPLVLFLAKHPLVDSYKLDTLEDVLCGGAPVGEELLGALRKRFPHIKHVRQGYGLTECVAGTHISPLYGGKPESCGVLLPNLECKIINQETRAILGPHQDGEICIRGPTVMKGYLNKPEATARTIDREGWLHTGDAGHYDEHGYFYIVDRIKELIKYKGFQVPPAELEALLITHPNIDDVAVIGVPDLVAGELPKAFVVRRGDVSYDDIVKFVEERVAPHKKLRGGVEFIDQIPKSPSGKILRRILRSRNSQGGTRSKL